MVKPHWQVTEPHPQTGEPTLAGFGCQHDECNNKATVQWQRAATDTEIVAEMSIQGPYGPVIRNPQGPHNIAVFACDEHALPPAKAALRHHHDCPAPHHVCDCDGEL